MMKMDWTFPLPRTHTGILLGNAVTGVMIWGEGSQLNITFGRSDLWDHRGGMVWSEKHRYKDIKACLEANDAEGMHKMFSTDTESIPGQPDRPSIIPVGRIELDLGDGATLVNAKLNLQRGCAAIYYTRENVKYTFSVCLEMETQLAALSSDEPSLSELWNIKLCPFYELHSALKEISFDAPNFYDQGDVKGWYQPFPVNDGIGVYYKEKNNSLFISNARCEDEAVAILNDSSRLDKVTANTEDWWTNYWKDIPVICTPDETVNSLYAYGMYKFAGFSQPSGVAGGLQGPWIEDYTLPPWSGDYHFNINVQMCYWPAYKSGRFEHLKPLFDLVFSWENILRDNAKKFIGIDDGFLLPHAVDDRATCMGSFWTGCIDHACTAWVADMMWNYVDFSGNVSYLEEKVLPFMTGAMRVYEEMLEKDGDFYRLPLSVSPEYRGAAMNAWGANASFQLAAVHRLLEDIAMAHEILGSKMPDSFKDIAEHLPKVTLFGEGSSARIGLWEGTDLEESHRHHSHLAALCPFDVINWEDEQWIDIVNNSIQHWISQGMGHWSGWCMPWASMIHSRLDNGDGAKLILDIWNSVFVNEGHGTLHDANITGLSTMGAPDIKNNRPENERMQLDAGFGAVAAIQDMMVHTRRGVIHVFKGVPSSWKNCSFEPMPCGGGFKVSASKENGVITNISIHADRDGTCKVFNPWTGNVDVCVLRSGESVTLNNN